MNLQTKLEDSLNDILKTSGYIFEIINNNKKQSNLITGSNNQLITPQITSQLAGHITKFDDVLDETISKFNDARWCIEQILENKQRQEELKLKEEMERQKRLKEEQERKRLEEIERKRKEEEERKRKEEQEAEAKAKAEREAAEKARVEEAARIKKEEEDRERKAKDEELKRQRELEKKLQDEEKQREELQKQQSQQEPSNDFNDFMSPGFDFGMGDITSGNDKNAVDIPNPSDILSSINYTDDPLMQAASDSDQKQGDGSNSNNNNNTSNNSGDLDLDMNNLLGNDESILDGLNMSLLDQRFDTSASNQLPGDDEFDVDNFLNQFGGSD